ncbi:hypothetical protein AB0368_09390 [Actinoplanes sp. NPDC051475]|uniref:hypothetical protein n=1 Tax=Actinoplanes sp. NPDC051475 TaxID=3157225 RepID=UPI003450487D
MPGALNVEIRRSNDRLREQGRPGSEAIWKTTIPERFPVRTDDIHVAALGARRQGLVMSRAGQRAASPQDNPASARRGRPEPVQNDQQTRVFGPSHRLVDADAAPMAGAASHHGQHAGPRWQHVVKLNHSSWAEELQFVNDSPNAPFDVTGDA